jgi:glycosyltransferase involved in cell wall biosynthesis
MNKKTKRKTTVAVIGTVGIPAKYGGFETLAEHLARHMMDDFQLSVYCTTKKYPKAQRQKTFLGARLIYLPMNANGASSILYDCLSILHALFYADVLLVLGVSGGILLPFVRRFTRKKIIVSIDGIEWKRDKWSKPAKLYLWWAEKIAVKYSHADISDNESIQNYTAYRYKTLSNIIEYGADHTMKVSPTPKDVETYPFLAAPYAFKVCRIEPENNIHVVLAAFARLNDWTLVMIGNWENSEYGKSLRRQYERHMRIILLDPIYDQARLDLIRGNAALYVHGHSAGGTNPSLVEAMYLGLPVLAFHVSYNKTTTENKAWYFSTADDIVKVVQNIGPQDLQEKAAGMKEIADRRYTWEIIARKYIFLIRKALATRSKSTIRPRASSLKPDTLLNMDMGHLINPSYFYENEK